MKLTKVLGILTIIMTLATPYDSFARKGIKETRTRLVAELVDTDDLEAEQMQAKFESRGERRRLHVEARNYAVGTTFAVSINIAGTNHLLGNMTIAINEEGIPEAEIDFRQDSWLVGLPEMIPAGSVVSVRQGNVVETLTLASKK